MAVARWLDDIHLVSADSMQVYRHMDIGTAKPTPAERAEVPHHCIDLVEPTTDFTVAAYKVAHADALADIDSAGGVALIVGGTGLYHRVVIDDFDLPGEWPDDPGGTRRRSTTVVPSTNGSNRSTRWERRRSNRRTTAASSGRSR